MQSFYCTVQSVRTPSDEEQGPDEGLACAEGVRHDDVQVQAFAKHPGKVAGRAVLGQHVQRLTPHLHRQTDRHTDRHTHTDRQTDRQTDRPTDRQTDKDRLYNSAALERWR